MQSKQSKQKNKRTTYKRITEQIRLQLIDRVVQKGQNLKNVINDMNVNISTAKAILKVYQQQGRVGKKKKRDKVINVIQTYSFYTVDGLNIQKISDTVVEQEKKSLQVLESDDIERDLKEKSKERAEQLMNQIIEKNKNSLVLNNINDNQRKVNDLTALQTQLFYQYCNANYPFCGIGLPGLPFK